MRTYEQNIVIDLEFNPTPKSGRNKLAFEIIEIGAVRLDDKGDVVDTFNCLVKSELSEYVTRRITALTGIRTCDVEDAPVFAEALGAFARWIGGEPARIVAWSSSDRRQIQSECAAKDVEVPPQMKRWLDLQKVYPRVMGVGDGLQMNLPTAINWYGSEMDGGSAHRALYDAKAAAALMSQLLSGSYRQQKAALESSLKKRCGSAARLSSTIGDACAGLAALKQQMLASGQASAVA